MFLLKIVVVVRGIGPGGTARRKAREEGAREREGEREREGGALYLTFLRFVRE